MRIFGYDLALRKAQSLPQVSPEENKFLMALMNNNMNYSDFGIVTPEDYDSLVNAYKSWVYVCSNINSTAVASNPIRLFVAKPKKTMKSMFMTKAVSAKTLDFMSKNAGIMSLRCVKTAEDIEEVVEHPWLDLLTSVNSQTNRFDLWQLTQLFLELTGNAYWYLLKNSAGIPAEIWVVPSQKMRVIPDREKYVRGYRYIGSPDAFFEAEEIIHFRFPSPSSVYYGWAPLQALAAQYNIDLAMNKYEENTFKNSGRADGVVQSDKDVKLNKDDMSRLRKEWNKIYGGIQNVSKTIFLPPGLTYSPVGYSPKELNYVKGRFEMMKAIAAGFGIPLSKITVENVNLANAKIGEYQYSKDTVLPRCKRLEEKINEQVMPLYDSRLFVMYDNPVPEDEEQQLREDDTYLKNGVYTINEVRERKGLEPVPWGDKPIMPTTMGVLGEKPPEPEGKPPLQPEEAKKFMDQVLETVHDKAKQLWYIQ